MASIPRRSPDGTPDGVAECGEIRATGGCNQRGAQFAVLTDARDVLLGAFDAGFFPAAAVDVGDSNRPLWQDTIGDASLDTPFDLASLTKPIAMGSILMRMVG